MNDTTEPTSSLPAGAELPPSVRIAGWIATVQGTVGVAFALYLVVHAATGYREQDVAISGYGTAVWFFVIAGAVLAAGVGLLRGRRWGRGLIVMAEILLLFVAWYAGVGSGQVVAGVVTGSVSVVALVALFRAEAMRWYAN